MGRSDRIPYARTTHNFFIYSVEGLKLETSAFNFLYDGLLAAKTQSGGFNGWHI